MMDTFRIFQGSKEPRQVERWPAAPPWRRGRGSVTVPRERIPPAEDASWFVAREEVITQVNAAIHLRRPLLVTGYPGTGKSSLAKAIAYGLDLGRLLVWPINSRSSLQEGLYLYDAIRRVQDAAIPGGEHDIGRYLRLGPLGTAMLPADRPRVLLIDEIDKSDIDLPNDLLHVLEEGAFHIPELARAEERDPKISPVEGDGDESITIREGRVQSKEYPIVVMTSNGEREFPAAFRRRCICVNLPEPSPEELKAIVCNHFKGDIDSLAEVDTIIQDFVKRRISGTLATDQLLNAILIRLHGGDSSLDRVLLRPLTDTLRPLTDAP